MVARLTWAAILSIVMIPMLAIGWLDPLEGLPALVIGIALAIAVRTLSKVSIPKFTWISFVVVAAIMVLTITLAVLQSSMIMAAQEAGDTAVNPLADGFVVAGVPLVNLLLWVGRAANVVMVAGLIIYSVRVFRALGSARRERVAH